MSLSNFVKRVRNIMRNDAGINGDAQRIEGSVSLSVSEASSFKPVDLR